MKFAGFWVRVAASLIDSLLIIFVAVILLLPGILSENVVYPLIMWPIIMVLVITYYIWMGSSSHQGTIGKKMLGLVIVDEDGKRLTVKKSAGRFVIYYLIGGVTSSFGHIVVAFTEKKQGVHDMAMKTYVVYKDSLAVSGKTPAEAIPAS